MKATSCVLNEPTLKSAWSQLVGIDITNDIGSFQVRQGLDKLSSVSWNELQFLGSDVGDVLFQERLPVEDLKAMMDYGKTSTKDKVDLNIRLRGIQVRSQQFLLRN